MSIIDIGILKEVISSKFTLLDEDVRFHFMSSIATLQENPPCRFLQVRQKLACVAIKLSWRLEIWGSAQYVNCHFI